MQSVIIVLMGMAGMAFGWFVYSRFIAAKVFRLDAAFVTPAHELNDGVDYVPTHRYVLWGHHFTSVAGAAPIVGPAIAVYWGWVPAMLWVVLGTIFFAGVHDAGALWASNRHKGRSIGALSVAVIGKRTRALFMVVIFLVLLMVNAVFGVVIANAFIGTPGSVLPAWAAIAVAFLVGYMLRRRSNLALVSAVGVGLLYAAVYAGSLTPIELPGLFGINSQSSWVIILFIYAAIASMLPVWMLLQPRDYINGIQLFLGLSLLYGAVLLSAPEVSAPAFNARAGADSPSILPLLFVTIACGAVSGFHGIVASGTTSKQLDRETDARFVGYLGAVGEGSLALITIVAVTSAPFAATPEAWHALYARFGTAGGSEFIAGGAALLTAGWGIPTPFAKTLLATMLVLFAATTMDTGVRLQRYIIQEWGAIYRIPPLESGVIATLTAVGACLLLAFGAGGTGGGGLVIWPLFGSTNQILAGLTLLIITVMLIKLGRPARYTMLPMIFVLGISFWAAAIKLVEFWRDSNWLLVVIDTVVLVTTVVVILEAMSIISRARPGRRRYRRGRADSARR